MAKLTGVRPQRGGIEVRWSYKGESFSRFINKAPTETNLIEASRQRKKFIELCKLGEYEEDLRSELTMTFAEVAEDMLKFKATRNKQSTLDSSLSKLNNHWLLLFDMPIDEIKLTHIRKALKELDHLKPKTITNSISDMKQVFKYAFEEELIEDDPSLRIRPPKVVKEAIDAFTVEERNAILSHMKPKFEMFYSFMFHCGLRTGEVQGLKWNDIDGNFAYVRRSIYRGNPTSTKTYQNRKVLLSPRTLELLEEHKANRFWSEWIFTPKHSRDPFCTDRTPTLVFKRACEEADVRYRRPYYARHTYATIALRKGIKPIIVAKQIGDRLETMMRNYADVMAELDDSKELAKFFD